MHFIIDNNSYAHRRVSKRAESKLRLFSIIKSENLMGFY